VWRHHRGFLGIVFSNRVAVVVAAGPGRKNTIPLIFESREQQGVLSGGADITGGSLA
jgi:hypothetical protein